MCGKKPGYFWVPKRCGLWTETHNYPGIRTFPFPFSRRTPEYTAILNRDFTSRLPFPLVVDHGPRLQGPEGRLQLVDV